jgi:two-component system, LytTR family, response regulator
MKISVVIVDDEATARRRLKRFLTAIPGIEIVTECASGAAAVAALRARTVDAVFLDVQMPEMNGFDVLRSVGADRLPLIVFVTAFDEFALKAFEAHAIDYLLKPFGEERVLRAVERVRTFLVGKTDRGVRQDKLRVMLESTSEHLLPSCLLVKRGDRVLVLRPQEIHWIESVGDYVKVHTGAESHLSRSTLSEMQERLAAEGFVRIHRSRLINLAHLKELCPFSRGESSIVLRDGTRLEASYAFLKDLQERLDARSSDSSGPDALLPAE